jgi:signal transduction histidine kinase
MYADILAEGMITDEASRRRYLETLRVEADRLGHLVENVLSYARLERGRVGNVRERIEIGPLLEPVIARMSERVQQAGKQLQFEVPPEADGLAVRTDPGAVEQIVMNLIDNACKYAKPASDPRIIVSYDPLPSGKGVRIAVRDFGPGIVKRPFRSLFRPFNKTAQEAAVSAPGVGLGLALCRRLARQLDGKLIYCNADGGGALLELHLP